MDDFVAFLRWNSGHLLETQIRHAYAEWLIHQALAIHPGDHRIEGSEITITEEGISLAIRSAAYVQFGKQDVSPVISFQIDHRSALLHIFCLLDERDPDQVNPQNRSQWLFWVVPTATLNAERRSIGLQVLIRAHGPGIGFEALSDRVWNLCSALRNCSRTTGEDPEPGDPGSGSSRRQPAAADPAGRRAATTTTAQGKVNPD